MGRVIAEMSMSLDGFVAGQDDDVQHVFAWYLVGDVEVPMADARSFRVSKASAQHIQSSDRPGALITGRRLFDLTKAWGGTHPTGAPVVVVTHDVPDGWPREGVPFTFVTDGIKSAVDHAQAVAGDKDVAIATANLTQQCLNAGLLDVLRVNLVPVLLGQGISFFADLTSAPLHLEDPTVIEGTGVTHLVYDVRR